MTPAASTAPLLAPAPPAAAILRPGETCWRLAPALRAAPLIDGAAYFAALRQALLEAQRSVLILGWDIRSDLRLDPELDGTPLNLFLDGLVRAREGLEVRILIWDWLLLYSLDRELLPWWRFGVQTHERVRFALDREHPAAGCQHEKLVVIDGSLAFVGGIDLTTGRWDTPAHRPHEPRRGPGADDPRPPFHDTMLMVEGTVAADLEELALMRWHEATKERVPAAVRAGPSAWPAAVEPWFGELAIGISRTRPAWNEEPPRREVEAVYLAAIKAARTSIYIENQYLTVDRIARALAARLAEPDGPELVIVTPKACEGLFETAVMDVGRARFVRTLRRADLHRRLAVMVLRVEAGGATAEINVHSKLLLVDDRLYTVGSANLANRSMGLDSECNLVVEAASERERRALRRLRATLLAEHLELTPEAAATALAETGGRLLPVIERLGPGRLRPLRLRLSPLLRQLASPARLADLDEPVTADRVADYLAPPRQRRRWRRLLWRIGLVLAVLLSVAVLLRFGLLGGSVWVERLLALAERHAASPLGGLIVLATFVLGSLVLVPVTLMIALTAAVMGPLLGFAYALGGATLASAVIFLLGRLLGRERIRRLAGRRLALVSQRFGRHGVLAVALVRLLPIAPFTVVSLVASIAEVSLRDFVLGSILGLTPGIALATLFGDRLGAWLRHPTGAGFLLLASCLVLLLGLGWSLQRWSGRRVQR